MNRMGILNRYSWILNPKLFLLNVHKVPSFIIETGRQGKLIEFLSFLIWEVAYKTGLYKNKYLQFTAEQPYIVTDSFAEELSCFNIQDHTLKESKINWKILIKGENGNVGITHEALDMLLFADLCSDEVKMLHKFTSEITSLFMSSSLTLLVCLKGGEIYRAINIFENDLIRHKFQVIHSLNLSHKQSFIKQKFSITETPDNMLLIGEYGNIFDSKQRWVNCAYIYESKDQGVTWTTSDFLIKKGINKHVHILTYSKLIDALILADGDNKKKTWIGTSNSKYENKINWRLVNMFHYQTGGYMSMAETNDTIFLGTDYLGGTNFIVQTKNGRSFKKQVITSPYRRCPVQDLQIRSSRLHTKPLEIWALLYNQYAQFSHSLLMFSNDDGVSWNKVIEFDASKYDVSVSSYGDNSKDELYLTVKRNVPVESGNNIRTYIVSDKMAG